MAQPWWEERVPPLSRRELFGAPRKGEGPLPLTGIAPQLQPLQGCSFVAPPISTPKSSRVTCVEFLNSLLSCAEGTCEEVVLLTNALLTTRQACASGAYYLFLGEPHTRV